MDELIAKAAEAMNMPAAMVRRSAEARAKAEERSVEEVLAEWAGVEVPSADADADAGETEADSAAAQADRSDDDGAADSTEEAPAEKPAATGVEKYVEIAAESMKMPASMIRRSAEARARTEGRSYEEVLADWAGVDVEEVRAAAEETEQAEAKADAAAEDATPEEAPETETAETEPDDEEADSGEEADTEEEAADEAGESEPAEPAVEVIGGGDDAAADAEPADEDDEAALVGAGAGLPMWLLTLFVIIPAFAIGYASFFPNGPNCGDAGSLAVDPMTGLAVNCDGSEYGEIGVDFFAMGAQAYAVCAGCHGQGGDGGAGPAFIGGELLATFPEGQCDMHVEWIRLGTQGWPEPTYGANQKPVGGFGAPMPGFGSLSDEELAAVALYERVQFGGEALETALVDCGLIDGDNGDESEDPADGDEDEPAGDEDEPAGDE